MEKPLMMDEIMAELPQFESVESHCFPVGNIVQEYFPSESIQAGKYSENHA